MKNQMKLLPGEMFARYANNVAKIAVAYQGKNIIPKKVASKKPRK